MPADTEPIDGAEPGRYAVRAGKPPGESFEGLAHHHEPALVFFVAKLQGPRPKRGEITEAGRAHDRSVITTRAANHALVVALAALKQATTIRHRLPKGSAEYNKALDVETRLNAEILDLALRIDWSRMT